MERVADLTKRVSSLPRGSSMTRYAMHLAKAKGDIAHAAVMAERLADSPDVLAILRSAANFGSTTDPTWASALSYYRNMQAEFVELLRPATIRGRLSGLRRVPFDVRFVVQNGGALVGWVGEGTPAPVGEMSLEEDVFKHAKAAGIVVFTNELAKSSSPAAEALAQTDLVAGTSQFLDQQFIDPAVAGVADVSPASITHGAAHITSSGTSVAAMTADVQALFALQVNAGITLRSPALIMRPSTSLSFASKRTAADVPAFPNASVFGGNVWGVPIIVSANVPTSVSGGSIIVLVDAAEIQVADDAILVDASEEAAIQVSSNPLTGAQSLVSLWQKGLTAVRLTCYTNWRPRRAAAVAYIDGVMY